MNRSIASQDGPKQALLVAVYRESNQKSSAEEHLEELAELVRSWGLSTVGTLLMSLRSCEAATFLTSGKIDFVDKAAEEHSADVVIFDDEISPAQQRNLEKLLRRPVLSRSEVILGVFADHARSREAKLQVALASSRYQAPRLKRLWTHLSRQTGTGGGGGGAYLKGEGEKQIEIDRRLLKRKIEGLESELKEVELYRQTQRQQRKKNQIPTFAIIGYTNAGKSTVLNALTDAEVLVEDKLFATLDTTTRRYQLPNGQEILLIDTVGFIRKLPHHLVASFRSTLEEALSADVLIHLIDSSSPHCTEKAKTTLSVLQELGKVDQPIITVWNKIDLLPSGELPLSLRHLYARSVAISAERKEGFDALLTLLVQEVTALRRQVRLRIPQEVYGALHPILHAGEILSQCYEENDVLIEARIPKELMHRLQPYEVPGE